MKGLCVLVVLVSLVILPGLVNAQVMGAGNVGLLSFGPGWYSGATRVTQIIVEKGGIQEIANVALSATVRGGLAGAVIMGMIAAEPLFTKGVDAIRTYMNNLGGSLYWSGNILEYQGASYWVPIAGTAVAIEWAADKGGAGVSGCGTGGKICNYVLGGNSQTTAQSSCNSFCQGASGGNCGSCSMVPSTTTVSCAGGCVVSNPGAGTITYNEYFYPANGTYAAEIQSQTPAPVPAQTPQLVTQLQTDLTAGTATVLAAADESESIIQKGLVAAWNPAAVVTTPVVVDQTAAPPTDGLVVTEPIAATPTTGATTAAQEAANVASGNLPSGGAISNSTPAGGTSTSTTGEAYTDPGFSGSLTTVPWAAPLDFGARWSTFASGVQSTGLFGLWGQAFGSPGSGGLRRILSTRVHWVLIHTTFRPGGLRSSGFSRAWFRSRAALWP